MSGGESHWTLHDYQRMAQRTTSPYTPAVHRLTISALGLAGESGEVVEHIKKFAGHGHPLDRDRIVNELGDVLWYVADIAACIGVSLDDVAKMNVDKLAKRYPDGFTTTASMERRDDRGGS